MKKSEIWKEVRERGEGPVAVWSGVVSRWDPKMSSGDRSGGRGTEDKLCSLTKTQPPGQRCWALLSCGQRARAPVHTLALGIATPAGGRMCVCGEGESLKTWKQLQVSSVIKYPQAKVLPAF